MTKSAEQDIGESRRLLIRQKIHKFTDQQLSARRDRTDTIRQRLALAVRK